jgi:hypothetical protein
MDAKFLDELKSTFEFPIYVVTRRDDSPQLLVDKMTLVDGKVSRPSRRFVLPGVQCSCLGWMKFKECRHLKMVEGDYSFVEPGVPASYAVDEAERLVEAVGRKHFPGSVSGWRVNVDTIPEVVTGFDLNIVGEGPRGS